MNTPCTNSSAATTASNGWPYAVARAPLTKWAKERVSLRREHGRVVAEFIYTGSTCNNLGHPVQAILSLTLLPNDGGDYQIVNLHCSPADDDTGCARMCAHLAAPETFFDDINEDHPLNGMTLSAAVAWKPELEFGGCLCSPESRNHKWRNAVQSIHYALHHGSD